MAGDDEQDKQHAPSQKKLDDARKRGEVPRSNDLSAAASFVGFFLVAAVFGPWCMARLGSLGVAMLASDGGFGQPALSTANGVLIEVAKTVFPVLLVPGALVVINLTMQRAFTFSGDKLAPKFSRISPLSNAKNKYGRNGLFEFAKSFVKLAVIAVVLAMFLKSRADSIVTGINSQPALIVSQVGSLATEFLGILAVVFGLIGAVDYLWQVSEHQRKNRMSHKELRDEAKESEGDPHFKQARRQRAQEIALSSMIADVAKASVVIVNPEHYAVALEWSAASAGPPACLAKGVDEVAARIRAAAVEAGVPIHRDPPTARSLYAMTEIGQHIHQDHFRAVAAAIRFADRVRSIAGKRYLQ